MHKTFKNFLIHAALIISIWLTLDQLAFAAKDDNSVFFFFGEALGPGNVRIGFEKFDLGLDFRSPGFYFGPRLWLGQAYVGSGPFLAFYDLGLYGMIGYEMSLFYIPLARFSAEFWAIGTAMGRTYGVGTLGLGVAW